MICFESDIELPEGPEWEAECRSVLEEAMDILEIPYACDVNVLITDDEGIREMNDKFRDIDRETDVLSFPMNEYSEPEIFDEDMLEFHPETGELLLGDIVINMDRVYRQAEEYGHSLKREFAFLLIHSLLHLIGHDHMTPEEEEKMRQRQRTVLEKLEILR